MANEPVPDPRDAEMRRVSDVAVSMIRTWAPMAAGFILTFVATRWGLVLSESASAAAGAGAAALCSAAYYALARWLETRRGDSWFAVIARPAGKWLLGGVVRQPVYTLRSEHVMVVRGDGTLRPPR